MTKLEELRLAWIAASDEEDLATIVKERAEVALEAAQDAEFYARLAYGAELERQEDSND